jgi:glutamate transport system permease protein
MSTSVLFDAPGPKARLRNNILTVVGALLVAGLVYVVIGRLADAGQFERRRWEWLEYEQIQRNLLDGLVATLKAFAIAAVLAIILGFALAIGRLSPSRWIRTPSTGFVTVFRALPVVVLMFIPYLAAKPLIGQSVPLLYAVVFGLVLYNGSVLAEIFRAGVLAVPKGQQEASSAIGLTRGQTLRLVLMPQAVRSMLPTIISQLVVVLKDTALGFVIGYQELLYKGGEVARTPRFGLPYIPVAIVIGLIYIALCSILSITAHVVERRTGARVKPMTAFAETVPTEATAPDVVLED